MADSQTPLTDETPPTYRGAWDVPRPVIVSMVVLALGLVLVDQNPPTPSWLGRLSTQVRPDAWGLLAGIYLLSGFVSHWCTYGAHRWMNKAFVLNRRDPPEDRWAQSLPGIVEGVMYPTAFLIGMPQFIAVWLAFKAVGQWSGFKGEGGLTGENGRSEDPHRARRRYNRFLVSNALRVCFGAATYGAICIFTFS